MNGNPTGTVPPAQPTSALGVPGLSVTLIDVMTSEAARSRAAVERDAAYHAAEAGIDDSIAKLLDGRLYDVHFVHPGEATRLSTASGRLVGATQAWGRSGDRLGLVAV